MKNVKGHLHPRAFSLLELLVVIVVIGILAAITIQNMLRVYHTSQATGNKRNAQQIAGMYNAARAGGAQFPTGASLDQIVDLLSSGVQGRGNLSNVQFKLNAITPERYAAAKQYLDFDANNQSLNYTGANSSGDN